MGSGGEQHDITRNEVATFDRLRITVAQHFRFRRTQTRQGAHRCPRPELLNESNGGVDQDDGENDAAVRVVTECQCSSTGDQKDVDEGIAELVDQQRPPGNLALDLDLVRPIALQACFGVLRRQAVSAALQQFSRGCNIDRVPLCVLLIRGAPARSSGIHCRFVFVRVRGMRN